MKFKKFIAASLSAAIVLSAVSFNTINTFAASVISTNKIITVKNGESLNDSFIKIQPSNEVKMDDIITIEFINGKISQNLDDYQYKALSKAAPGKDYDSLKTDFEQAASTYTNTKTAFDNAIGRYFSSRVGMGKTIDAAELPYKLNRNTDRIMEVTLFALPEELAGETYESTTKPFYKIPLPVSASDEGDIIACVNSNSTSITGGNIKIADSVSSKGSTCISITGIKKSKSNDIELNTISIKESVYGTFVPGEKVILTAENGTFKNSASSPIEVSAGINADFVSFNEVDLSADGKQISFLIPEKINSASENGYSLKSAMININNILCSPERKGNVEISISGDTAGITSQKINAATYLESDFICSLSALPTQGINILKPADLNLFIASNTEENIVNDGEIALTLSEGFKFIETEPMISFFNANSHLITFERFNEEKTSAIFKLENFNDNVEHTCDAKLLFDNLLIEPIDSNKKGDVFITLSGGTTGISEQTILVGNLKNEEKKEDNPLTILPQDFSNNSINRTVNIYTGDFSDDVSLKIVPKFGIQMYDTIIITLENAEFNEDDMDIYYTNATSPNLFGIKKYDYNALAKVAPGKTFKILADDYESARDTYLNIKTAFDNAIGKYFSSKVGTANTQDSADMPYSLRLINKNSMEVTLFALPDELANETYEGTTKPAYKIPLPFTAGYTPGNVKITIDANGNSINNGTYEIAKVLDSKVSASIKPVSITAENTQKVALNDLYLSTYSYNYNESTKINIKLNDDYKFSSDVITSLSTYSPALNDNKDTLSIEIPKGISYISGLSVDTNGKKDDISLSIFGDGAYIENLTAVKFNITVEPDTNPGAENTTEPDTENTTESLYDKMNKIDKLLDIDNNGKLDANDAAIILRRVLDKSYKYPNVEELLKRFDKNNK